MIIDRSEHITSITAAAETYILDKSNMTFTYIDANFEVSVCHLEYTEDFNRIYENYKKDFEISGVQMSNELEKWFADTYNSIRE